MNLMKFQSVKRCVRCCEEKATSEFCNSRYTKDRLECYCRICKNIRARERYKRPDAKAKTLARCREYYQKHREVWIRREIAYKADGRRKDVNRKYWERYPEKNKARWNLNYGIKTGKIKRQPCEVCGHANAEAHHADYSKPFEVVWLCSTHHAERHRINISKLLKEVA